MVVNTYFIFFYYFILKICKKKIKNNLMKNKFNFFKFFFKIIQKY